MIISKNLGPIRRSYRIGEDEELDQVVFDELSRLREDNASPNVLILQEAWQPPIKESLLFIAGLRKVLDTSSSIRVGLIGRPRQPIGRLRPPIGRLRPDNFFTPVKEEEWTVWHRKLKALEDPYLGLLRLVGHYGK